MGWANNPITRYCIQLIKTGLTELRCLTATLVPVLKKADAKQIAKPTNGFKPYITFRQLGLLFLPWFSFRAAIIFPGLLSLCQLTMGWNPKILCNFDKAALFTTKKFQEKKFKRWSRRSLKRKRKTFKNDEFIFWGIVQHHTFVITFLEHHENNSHQHYNADYNSAPNGHTKINRWLEVSTI